MRQSDLSYKWQLPSLLCPKCQTEKPHAAFIVHRKTSDCLGNTCIDCRSPRTAAQKTQAIIIQQRWRAKRAGVVSTLTLEEWVDKLKASDGFCQYCSAYIGIELLTIDHIIALDNGGANSIDNVAPVCWKCNVHKATS